MTALIRRNKKVYKRTHSTVSEHILQQMVSYVSTVIADTHTHTHTHTQQVVSYFSTLMAENKIHSENMLSAKVAQREREHILQ